VVDDDAALSEMLRLALMEYEVETAGSAERALDLAGTFEPDLVIVDYILPGMRGTAFAGRLREIPQFTEMPVFLLSGIIDGRDDGEPLLVEGLPAFRKPFSLATLERHVALHLTGGDTAKEALAQLAIGSIEMPFGR
jgi:DNA-binding response OmpR family regulator